MQKYRPTIGLEIHAELNTLSKMFCGCKNDPDEERPNINICPICMAHPGALPVINKEAVHKVLRVGAALKARRADHTVFDRKNYFYPDIPKGFQISQYKDPLVSGGELAGVAVTRVHLEEDTARSSHTGGMSRVDFNRAGVPLMELVTEPCITSAAEAGLFARELRLLLRYLGVSEANMEKGEMRVEANISVSQDSVFGTKVEVKNLNSFRSVEHAIEYEIKRQSALLDDGGTIEQETRGWDENGQRTFSQRKKESSHDYRYFPEPDLPPLILSEVPEFEELALQAQLPELPVVRRARYVALGLAKEDADMFVRERILGSFFDDASGGLEKDSILLVANYLASDVAGAHERGEISEMWLRKRENALRFGHLMSLLYTAEISSRGAKEILKYMVTDDDEPRALAEKHDLLQKSDESFLEEVAQRVIDSNGKVVEEYRHGKVSALQFLVGQGMKESLGSANPAVLRSVFERLLK